MINIDFLLLNVIMHVQTNLTICVRFESLIYRI